MIKDGKETIYRYNINGNLTEKITPDHTFKYGYDTLNQLITITKDDVVMAEYFYDSFGRRVQKKVGETITRFVYSDEGLLGQYSEEGSHLMGFVWRVDGLWGTNPLLQLTGDDVYVYHNNHLGAPESLNTMEGVAVWRGKRETFGQLFWSFVDAPQPLGLPGQYFDEESGLYYNYHRYYDAETGRYITQDPMGFDGGISLYAYAAGNPVGLSDPLGLLPELPQWLVDGAAGFGDAISFGGTKKIRQSLGVDGVVNSCSAAYGAGNFAGGEVRDFLLGGLAGKMMKGFRGARGARAAKKARKGEPNIPDWKGSGPVPGTIGINAKSKSNAALKNYNPKNGGIEFIYDTKTKTFVAGEPKYPTDVFRSPHEKLADSIGAKNHDEIVGGMFKRDSSGNILTNEHSGHFGENWTSERRSDFKATMDSYGVPVNHENW